MDSSRAFEENVPCCPNFGMTLSLAPSDTGAHVHLLHSLPSDILDTRDLECFKNVVSCYCLAQQQNTDGLLSWICEHTQTLIACYESAYPPRQACFSRPKTPD
ncbi:hypothetical protein HRR83_000320 [Exophiala dermatitidis]|uniref:Uncharacterized protein n=1 Tax=Exophiala dermatitidis TaxID=5970 RepID=A0AAN6F164_EXODE|nr:hypothetical protein HRR73_002856 [Exophiala dermatitidis]KAJ4527568.1 hypothetical protein HRR74_000322 [Exophiala dermatitidis]KAJ4531142.1 hypothetical protein HRR76_008818 [Exophiala dermatitidis]KAJ4558308.1 hypothetical protein HRR77_000321 [Exophiala dermatitidis]KAJ4581655.1 hypothetical protein HRR79_000673 [Exophiala dermatitidis]